MGAGEREGIFAAAVRRTVEDGAMEIPVLIEPTAPYGFRARGCEPFAITAEGATQQEALQNLRTLIAGKLTGGAKIVPLDVSDRNNSWLSAAPLWDKDDPLVKEWIRTMEENRLKDEADPDYL
jgi:hypothetical protein